jgi:putative membrane protein
MMMGYGYGSGLGLIGMGIGLITHLAFTALILMSVYWLFKSVTGSTYRTGGQFNALEILKQRYAKGEITSEEYQFMKKELI